jgi:hypothetical protein
MLSRPILAAVLTAFLATAWMAGARAQQPISSGPPATTASGWTFDLTPYLWIPSIHSEVNYNLPPALGGTVSANPVIGMSDLVSHLNIGFTGAADAHYGRFSVLTDIMWLNVGGVAGQFQSLNFPNHPAIPISGTANSSQSLKLNTEIWTLAGGYTVAQGDWGNLDAILGFRLFAISSRTNYSLGVTIAGPRGNGATFGGVGGVSSSAEVWNAVTGIRGRIRLGDTLFFVPYYFDVGAGGSNLTWQMASGVGYQTPWCDVSITYRYLSFEQSSHSAEARLWMQGPMLAVNFRF